MAWVWLLWVGTALADVAPDPGCRCDASSAPVVAGAVMIAALGLLGFARRATGAGR